MVYFIILKKRLQERSSHTEKHTAHVHARERLATACLHHRRKTTRTNFSQCCPSQQHQIHNSQLVIIFFFLIIIKIENYLI